MANRKAIATWVLAGIGAVAFLFAGITKALGMEPVGMLHEAIGTPIVMLRIIGGVEAVLAVLLLWPKTRWYSAGTLGGMMLVAAIWHIVAGDVAGAPGSIVLGSLMGVLAWIDRPEWFRSKCF